MTEERNFLVVSENNEGEFGITFDWEVIETEIDAMLILGILDRVKVRIHNLLDAIEDAEMDDEDSDEDGEEDECY